MHTKLMRSVYSDERRWEQVRHGVSIGEAQSKRKWGMEWPQRQAHMSVERRLGWEMCLRARSICRRIRLKHGRRSAAVRSAKIFLCLIGIVWSDGTHLRPDLTRLRSGFICLTIGHSHGVEPVAYLRELVKDLFIWRELERKWRECG
jgi:hypothetical protein